MRYKINSKVLIRTENAAKPRTQFSKFLKKMILDLEPVGSSIDYGCGKLRYTGFMLKTTDTLAIIDSEIQLSRIQKLVGQVTTIRELSRKTNRVSAYNTTEFGKLAARFDRAFCLNVLSVIPSHSARKGVVALILDRLKPDGTCLFVVQYRNSDFSRMKSMPNAKKWLDGFLIDSLRGYSFYGMISPSELSRLVENAGFEILDQKLNEGIVYVLAKRTNTLPSRPRIFEIEEKDGFRIR